MKSPDLVELSGWVAAKAVSDDDWRVNTWVVRPRGRRESAIIDFGTTLEQVQGLLAGIDGVAARLLLTHGHHDHVANAQAVSDAMGLPIEVHAADRRLVRQSATWSIRFSGRSIRTPQRVEVLGADGRIGLGGQSLEVRHAPGHTPGSVVFVAEGLVFTGDTLLRGRIGRTDLPGGDRIKINGTVDELVTRYPEDWRVLPGHGQSWTIGEARDWWRDHAADPPVLDAFDA